MKSEKTLQQASNFWNTCMHLKAIKRPHDSWLAVCEEAGVNYNTYRSARNAGSLPNGETMASFATFFGVTVDYMINGLDKSLDDRRKKVAERILTLDNNTFLMVERLLDMVPRK